MTEDQLIQSKICVLPYTHIATHPDGYVTLCCESDKTLGMDRARNKRFINLNIDSPAEVLKCDYYRDVRTLMENGEEPAACTKCYDLERHGVESKRVYEIKQYFKRNRFFSTELSLRPEFIELRLGNTCTLKCITCNPISSSALRPVFKELAPLQFIPRSYIDPAINVNWTEDPRFWDALFADGNGIHKIYINGGEPTLIKEHWRFLERLMSRGQANKVELQYNINLTQMKPEWIELWKNFKLVLLGCSIDDLGPRNEWIRYGSNWGKTMANLKLLREAESPSFHVYVTQTISSLNVGYADEMYDSELFAGINVVLNFVTDPSFLNPATLPQRVKDWVLRQKRADMLAPHLIGSVDESASLLEYLNKLSSMNRPDWTQVFPELARLLQP